MTTALSSQPTTAHAAGVTRSGPPHEAPHEAPHTRLRYVDALRVGAIAMVFVIHVCEVFNPWDQWHITNPQRSRVLGEVVVLMAPWIMPLVMLLAGVSAWNALPRRDNAGYVGERTRRILLPLVAGTLLLVPVQVWLERRLHGQFAGSLIAFYPRFFHGIYPTGNFSWHHLWFLGHLYLYSLLALPLFRYLQRPAGTKALDTLGEIAGRPGGIMWLALPLVLERSVMWGLFPERHMLTSDWSNHALLFVAYLYGFVFAGSRTLRAAIDARWPHALAAALIFTAALMVGTWLNLIPARLALPYARTYVAFWFLYGTCAWAWMVVMLGVARRFLDVPVPRRAEQSAYGWYLLHQPIIVAIAFVVVQWRSTLVVKAAVLFIVSGVGTLVATAAVRNLPVTFHWRGARRTAKEGHP